MIDFNKYDSENPEIWNAFVLIARKAKARGFKHYSAYGVCQIIRWETAVHGNDGFKMSNNYQPDYARKMMKEYPEFDGFFRLRELSVDRMDETPTDLFGDPIVV